ncbi:zf-UBP-domain-containing protein [Moesziomyces antarcticus]|uniref:Zf-UBP-domain-containing protein n=2 Tax=Pseudozyma antarctica TaxID=84753 RepID=A0A081CMZ9_PSEA2|nr:zf-UBP-domain-containing protein [Moesziomyces antarcticus]GAK68045.1 zf-UBP-domain-containing protein [Moesziomyces antarcticus]
MPTKPRKSAPAKPAFFLEQQETYSVHFSLFQPNPALAAQAPFQSHNRIVPDAIFAHLPDSAWQGDHGRAAASQRSFLYRDRSTKSFGSPIDIRFGPIRIDWAERSVAVAMADMKGPDQGPSDVASGPSSSSAQTSGAKPHRKKNVFHAKQPQVSLPVATFDKTDSFQGDSSSSKDAGHALASCTERFDGMTIGATEVAFGIVHLFRDKQEAMASSSSAPIAPAGKSAIPSNSTSAAEQLQNQIPDHDLGTVVAVLAVPSHLTASHFLSFIEPAVEAITHLRMVRDMHPNRCMVLIRFRDAKDAEDFHKMFNGQPFNAMDPQEICQVVYITSLTVSKHTSLPFSYPTLTNSDPWPLRPPANASNHAGHELPTCPVCLERMDSSVTGLMTISCQHTFHCSCLSKWGESRCPVCRYSQTGQASAQHRRRTPRTSMDPSTPSQGGRGEVESDDESDADEPSCCAVCETQQDLWVCLVCASVGCGRYKQGHAHRHFSETGHLYSLELETQRVWDYAGDGYVHRLIQNKADGKLVELPSASSATATPERSRTLPASASYASAMSTSGTKYSGPPANFARGSGTRSDAHDNDEAVHDDDDEGRRATDAPRAGSSRSADDKLEAIGMEYSYLLTSQLESQRHFYEDKLDQFQAQLTAMTGELASLSTKSRRIDELEQRTAELERTNDALRKDKDKSERKADKAVELARTLERDLHSERSISKGLMERLERTKESEAALQAQVTDLQEQVGDLMFFVQAREKIDQEGGEAQGGDVEMRPKSTRKGKGRRSWSSSPTSVRHALGCSEALAALAVKRMFVPWAARPGSHGAG